MGIYLTKTPVGKEFPNFPQEDIENAREFLKVNAKRFGMEPEKSEHSYAKNHYRGRKGEYLNLGGSRMVQFSRLPEELRQEIIKRLKPEFFMKDGDSKPKPISDLKETDTE